MDFMLVRNNIAQHAIFVNISISVQSFICRFGAGLSYEDYEAIARHKLERQGSANLSRTRKYPAGMTYEEIASSRSVSSKKQEGRTEQDDISPDRNSQESIEPLQEQDIKATGPDPYEKLNYKAGD